MTEPRDTPGFTWLDYVLFSAMLAVSAATGLYHALAGGGQKSTAKFLMAERSMMSIPIAISVLASYLSAITILGVPSEVFIYGVQYWMVIWCYFIAIPLTALIYVPVFHGLGVTSAYEYLHKRFSMVVRICGAVLFILQTCLYLGVVSYAPALALEAVTSFPVWATVLVTGVVCTVYTALGGIKAVIWTDVFQFVVLFGSLVTILGMGVVQAGGFPYIWNYNNEHGMLNFFEFNPNPTERLSFWSLTIGGAFNTLPIWAISQISVQRFLTAKNLKEAKKSVWYGLPGSVVMLTLVSILGLVLFAFYNNKLTPLLPPINSNTTQAPQTHSNTPKPHYTPDYESPDQILIYFVSEEFGKIPGIQGLFVSCLFAGTLSTVASGLNSLAAVTLVDIIRPWRSRKNSQHEITNNSGIEGDEGLTNQQDIRDTLLSKILNPDEVDHKNSQHEITNNSGFEGDEGLTNQQDIRDTLLSKILTTVYGAVGMGLAMLATQLGSLVSMVNSVFGAVGGPLLGLFSLGMLYRRANSGGALIGLLAGFCMAMWVTIGAISNTKEDGTFKEDTFTLYKLSFMWYSAFSSIITFLVGVGVSEVVRWRIIEERYTRVDPLLLATFLRPKGWHSTASGTEILDPDLQIGDPVFQSLINPREEELREEDEDDEEEDATGPSVVPIEDVIGAHEMASVNSKSDQLTSNVDEALDT